MAAEIPEGLIRGYRIAHIEYRCRVLLSDRRVVQTAGQFEECSRKFGRDDIGLQVIIDARCLMAREGVKGTKCVQEQVHGIRQSHTDT